MRRLVRVQILDNGHKYNTEAMYDGTKYEVSFPGQIIKAWELGVFGKELPVPTQVLDKSQPAAKS